MPQVLASRGLVVDANCLIRIALNSPIAEKLLRQRDRIVIYVPQNAASEAYSRLPEIMDKRGAKEISLKAALQNLGRFLAYSQLILEGSCADQLSPAAMRIADRDPDDVPVVATALTLQCPIWTEDKDFFGIGLPTWTTGKLPLYLGNAE
jgi:predicted nucleic acid-binding protein